LAVDLRRDHADDGAAASRSPLLQVTGAAKHFGGVPALTDAHLTVARGQVVALVGENGAGKSTLVKALAGVHELDAGEMAIDGQPYAPQSPRDGLEIGLAVIYQEPSLFPDLSIAENIFVGQQPRRRGRVDWAPKHELMEAYLEDVHSVTIEQIIAEHGARVPAWPDAPRNFRALFVVASAFPLTDRELARWSEEVRRFTMPARDGSSRAPNFFEATGGRATLVMDGLENALRSVPRSIACAVTLTDSTKSVVHSPADMPDRAVVASIEEPYIRATILCPKEHVGAVMELCQERRGTHTEMTFLSTERVQLQYDLPLAEIVLDFFDQLKSRTRGYASLDYEVLGMREGDLVKLDILLAGDKVDALSMVVHRDKAYAAGRALTERLRKQIPRQQFEVAIQAAIGSKIIARESVKPIRKDVIAKCYGGDVTRKRKLLEKQKEGKKRMKQVGRIEVPQEAFLAVLELDE
jgi:ABC-type sugar transport system ATPase subunit